jgi:hypothetical protein
VQSYFLLQFDEILPRKKTLILTTLVRRKGYVGNYVGVSIQTGLLSFAQHNFAHKNRKICILLNENFFQI